jgi:hypothetical protein
MIYISHKEKLKIVGRKINTNENQRFLLYLYKIILDLTIGLTIGLFYIKIENNL